MRFHFKYTCISYKKNNVKNVRKSFLMNNYSYFAVTFEKEIVL